MKRIGLNKISLGAIGTPLVTMNTIGYHQRSASPTPSYPSWLFRDMVLWYDISKQGATNDSLRLDPVLKDFSGNGHDLTLHNFAFAGNSGIGGENNEYPNALVTDGVDDYGFVEGLPLLEDFTIIVKRKYLNFPFDCVLANKLDIGNNDTRGISGPPLGAFVFELIESYGTRSSVPNEDAVINYSFGLYNVDLYQDIGDISYMTATSYNGKPINKGESTDTDFLYIATADGYEYGFANVAIYSVLLFNRSLSQEEINYVIDNLIGRPNEQYLMLEEGGHLMLEDGNKLTIEQ